MKKLILLIALVGCGTDTCPAGTKMGLEGHCIAPLEPFTGSKSTATDEPTTIGESYDAGTPEWVTVGGSGGKAPDVVHDASAESSGGRGGEGGGSAGQASLPSQTAGTGGQESGGGGEGGRKEAGGSPALDSGVVDAGQPALDSGQIQEPPRCGDGHKDPGEVCDGDCVADCDDSDPCTIDTLKGSAVACDAVCSHTPITKAINGDMCCPTDANSGTDSDCPVSCGNGVIDSGEICDGNCKTSCPTVDACHPGKLQGSPQMCNVTCSTSTITAAKSGDGCCPDGANANSDSDCAPVCGNGIKEKGELCDGDCATSCPSNGCSVGRLTGSDTQCNVDCQTTTIATKVNGDGCCPANSDFNSDSDCAPPAGCTQPSASNMLKNPGFATGTIGWAIEDGSGTVGWTSGDAESCSVSGSVQLGADHQHGRIISQCMPVTGGSYHFSVRIKGGGDGGQTTCAVVTYQLADCKGSGKALAEADWVNVDWGPQTSYAFDVDASMTSIYVGCYINANGVAATSEVDMLYLGKEDKAF